MTVKELKEKLDDYGDDVLVAVVVGETYALQSVDYIESGANDGYTGVVLEAGRTL